MNSVASGSPSRLYVVELFVVGFFDPSPDPVPGPMLLLTKSATPDATQVERASQPGTPWTGFAPALNRDGLDRKNPIEVCQRRPLSKRVCASGRKNFTGSHFLLPQAQTRLFLSDRIAGLLCATLLTYEVSSAGTGLLDKASVELQGQALGRTSLPVPSSTKIQHVTDRESVPLGSA